MKILVEVLYITKIHKGKWFRDNFSDDGIYQNKESLSFAQVLAHEVQHNVDLNGDTFIGNTVKLVLADDGNIGVYQKVTGEYIIDDPGKLPGDSTNTIYLKKGSKDFTAGNQVTGALIEDGEVSLYEGKDAKWNEHTFGYDLASETGTLSGSQAMTLDNIFALEDSENKDLNDDGVIGNAITSTYNVADEAGDLDWGFYRLASGDYITDDNGLTIGLKPTDNQKTLFKKGTTPHTFTTEPTSALGYTENGGGVYYQTTSKGKTTWKRDNFNDDRVFKNTETLTFKEILDHEETYNFDINKDGSVGDVVAEVLTNDGNGHGLYKTVSGLFVIDDSGLSVGSATTDPTILTQQVTSRGKTTTSNYEFTQTPTGIVFDSDGTSGIYYQDTSGNWFRESFSSTGVFTTQETYSLSQLFADESKYKNDLNNDGNIGDVITAVIGDNGSIGLYQTGSGSYLIDNSGLGIGDSSVSPTLLTQQVTLRGKTSTSLYDFSNTPTGALSFKDGSGVGVYYQDSKGAWKRDSFDNDGVFQADGFINDQ